MFWINQVNKDNWHQSKKSRQYSHIFNQNEKILEFWTGLTDETKQKIEQNYYFI